MLNDTLLQNLTKKEIGYRDKRQGIISENIANINTPDYIPKDVTKPDFRAILGKKIHLATTNKRHISGLGISDNLNIFQKPDGDIVKLDGNGVILDEQLFKASENAGGFRASTNLYQKINNLTLISTSAR